MTATFTCPECGTTTDQVTKRATDSFQCQCSSCGHQWLSDDKGEVMQTPTEPDGRGHKLRLGQRTGHVAVLASMPTRSVLSILMEAKKSGTYWCAKCQTAHHIFSDVGQAHRSFLANKHEISLLNRRDKEKLAAHDAIKRDSTELGATPPVAKGETAALCATPKRVEQQAKNLVVNVLERHRHPCTKCGGEGTVVPEGETEPVACSACHGTGSVRRRQESSDEPQWRCTKCHHSWGSALKPPHCPDCQSETVVKAPIQPPKGMVPRRVGRSGRSYEAVPSNPNFKLRPMSDEEWQGYQGAESPASGDRPLMGEVTLDGKEGVVIVDANSVQVHIDQPPSHTDSYIFPIAFSQGHAIAQQVGRLSTVQELLNVGFEKISAFHPENPVKEDYGDELPPDFVNDGPPEHVPTKPDLNGWSVNFNYITVNKQSDPTSTLNATLSKDGQPDVEVKEMFGVWTVNGEMISVNSVPHDKYDQAAAEFCDKKLAELGAPSLDLIMQDIDFQQDQQSQDPMGPASRYE